MPASPMPLTYDDLAAFPSDGRRYELVDGELSVSPSPGIRHQRILGRLFLILANHVREPSRGEVFLSPLDCILSPTTVLEPDIVFVAPERQSAVSERGIEGAPTLAIEIISPSSGKFDRVTKSRLFARHGIPFYWIIDPEARTIEAFALRGGSYALVERATGAAAVALPPFPSLPLVPEALFA